MTRSLLFRRRLARRSDGERGAVFVEMLLMVPLLALIWIIFLFLNDLNDVSVETAEQARYCAWRYAVDECERKPVARNSFVCDTKDLGMIPDVELRGAAQGGFETVLSEFVFLASPLAVLHGYHFRTTTNGTVPVPFGDRRTLQIKNTQHWTCQTPTEGPLVTQTPTVWFLGCIITGQSYCYP